MTNPYTPGAGDREGGDGPSASLRGAARRKSVQETVLDLLASGAVLSGLENCHIPGMYSLVFKPRESAERGILRMFYVGEKKNRINRLTTQGEFSLLPHNHRQDITLYRLFADYCRNFTVDFGLGIMLDSYEFGSALLNGDFELRPRGTRYATFTDEKIPAEGMHLPADVMHTVVASSPSAWIVEEGQLSEAAPMCYSLLPKAKLSAEGLYLPMDRNKIESVSREILEFAQ